MGNRAFALLITGMLAAVMAPAIVLAANGQVFGPGGGFDAVVRGIEQRYHERATKVPLMGLISGIAGMSTHGGVKGIHVAEFEHVKEPMDGTELNDLVEQRVGRDWRRMIRDTSRNKDGERIGQSLIYVRDEGERIGMLVVDLDGGELDVVQLSVNPDRLSDEIGKHVKHHEDAAKDDGDAKHDEDGRE
jgi:hypothetical protein